MYSLVHKKESAHNDSIWSCAWGRHSKEKSSHDQDGDHSRDSITSDDGAADYIVTGGVDDLVKVWELEDDSLKMKHELEGHSLGVISVAVSNDGKLCASSSLDSSMRIWNLQKGEKITTIDCGPVDLWTLAFSPDDKHIISGSQAGIVSVYSVETAKLEKSLDTTRGKFTLSIAYSPDGKYIASGAIDGFINIFDVDSNKLCRTLNGHAMPIRSLCFSPDSQLLLTASDDGHMKLYDVQHANVVGTLSGHASWVLSVSFSPDGKYFVSGSSDKSVKVWEVSSKQCIHTFNEHNDQVWGVKFNPDNNKILSVSEDKSMNIYNCPVE